MLFIFFQDPSKGYEIVIAENIPVNRPPNSISLYYYQRN